ncbi:hypothetical protein R3Q06_35005 [Rhodococcus erythropolis]|uniref:hypothetical protein n=1 Tax=Rhodococcus erythropolis TaxID=1833 RepID=UPI0029495101|nr:hypothetical protein [Rhodococcus erythropolis]MDV6278602.1 hypothetical protein [Rhodococcus erythropolis]
MPSGVAVDDAKNVYIADTRNHRVVEVNARGELAIATDLTGVSSVAVDAAGANVYVATSNGVLKIDRKTGTRTARDRAGQGIPGDRGDVRNDPHLVHPVRTGVRPPAAPPSTTVRRQVVSR